MTDNNGRHFGLQILKKGEGREYFGQNTEEALEQLIKSGKEPLDSIQITDMRRFGKSSFWKRYQDANTLVVTGNANSRGSPQYKTVIIHGQNPLTNPERLREAWRDGLRKGGAAIINPDEFEQLLNREGMKRHDEQVVYVRDTEELYNHKPNKKMSVAQAMENAWITPLLGEKRGRHYLEVYKKKRDNQISIQYNDDRNKDFPLGRLVRHSTVGLEINTSLDTGRRFIGVNPGLIKSEEPDREELISDLKNVVPNALHTQLEEIISSYLN